MSATRVVASTCGTLLVCCAGFPVRRLAHVRPAERRRVRASQPTLEQQTGNAANYLLSCSQTFINDFPDSRLSRRLSNIVSVNDALSVEMEEKKKERIL